MSTICHTVFMVVVTSGLAAQASGDPRPPHVLFLVGEQEYGTAESLPEFADSELKARGLNYSFVFAKSDDRSSAECHVFPGLAQAIRESDLLVISVRRRFPSAENMALIKEWASSGKPILGIRTASHAFGPREGSSKKSGYLPPDGHAGWAAFDQEILGGDYQGHFGQKDLPLISPSPAARQHPILQGIDLSRPVKVTTSLYKQGKLAEDAAVLLVGRLSEANVEHPVAWTRENRKGRTFYTSLGSTSDLKVPAIRAMLVNAVYWTLNRKRPASADKEDTK